MQRRKRAPPFVTEPRHSHSGLRVALARRSQPMFRFFRLSLACQGDADATACAKDRRMIGSVAPRMLIERRLHASLRRVRMIIEQRQNAELCVQIGAYGILRWKALSQHAIG